MPEGRNGELIRPADLRRAEQRHRDADPRPLVSPLQHFYRTSTLPCPYLPAQSERKLITELAGRDARGLYDDLCRAGFRRSHHLAYRPSCAGCNACVPVRIAVERFEDGRSSRRIRKANADLVGAPVGLRATAEQYRLFARYERSRHADSEMAAMTFGDYRAMIEDSSIETRLIEFRDADRTLLGGCLIDVVDDGYSAVYSFFEPSLMRRSLGTFMVLWLIDDARAETLPYIYLGYWIAESEKMSYKTRFRPLEALSENGWQLFES
ncbi:MAG TPA: arginyltransferase [Stellaceae bacterium]|jgi:arginine-tRNA-protein transferase|nr:arginyltransferase [Stellaceae bacterium]